MADKYTLQTMVDAMKVTPEQSELVGKILAMKKDSRVYGVSFGTSMSLDQRSPPSFAAEVAVRKQFRNWGEADDFLEKQYGLPKPTEKCVKDSSMLAVAGDSRGKAYCTAYSAPKAGAHTPEEGGWRVSMTIYALRKSKQS